MLARGIEGQGVGVGDGEEAAARVGEGGAGGCGEEEKTVWRGGAGRGGVLLGGEWVRGVGIALWLRVGLFLLLYCGMVLRGLTVCEHAVWLRVFF